MDPIFNKQEVVVIDIRMPFLSMVNFMVKWAIATIPAMIILVLAAMFFLMLIKAFFMAGAINPS